MITFGVVRNVWCYLFQTVVIVVTQRHLGIVGLSLLRKQDRFTSCFVIGVHPDDCQFFPVIPSIGFAPDNPPTHTKNDDLLFSVFFFSNGNLLRFSLQIVLC